MRSLLRTGLLLLPLLAAGCDHIEYHPYDTDISGEQDINAKNIARIEAACRGRQTVRFAMISDTQRWYDETEKPSKRSTPATTSTSCSTAATSRISG